MVKTETLDNHIIRSIIQPLEKPAPRDNEEQLKTTPKTFTTEPKHYVKRGCNTVRSRCIFYLDSIRAMGYTMELPVEKAKELLGEILGVYDRTTVKAYFGTLPSKSSRKMRRYARYQSGTQSCKDLELTQDIKKTKGYLEKLGLVTYEKHGKTWFMVLENLQIVPIIMKANKSIDKISLTSIHQGKECEKTVLEVVSPKETVESKQIINNNNHRVREKFFGIQNRIQKHTLNISKHKEGLIE